MTRLLYTNAAINCLSLGKPWQEKVKDVREKMSELKADLLVITATDEIAWLLNLRGDDIPYNSGNLKFFQEFYLTRIGQKSLSLSDLFIYRSYYSSTTFYNKNL